MATAEAVRLPRSTSGPNESGRPALTSQDVRLDPATNKNGHLCR
jgi:hypothetical protein